MTRFLQGVTENSQGAIGVLPGGPPCYRLATGLSWTHPLDVAAITSVRNDRIFLRKWIDYYGGLFGAAHLFVILDGYDQEPPENAGGVNLIRLPHKPAERLRGDARRARLISDIARGLHRVMDVVIATDVDEFILPDPAQYADLADYLARAPRPGATVSGLGLDIGQHMEREAELDPAQPFLNQRCFAHVSARYTKPSISYRPVTWGSGIHRVKGRNFHIAPDLYHLHFGMVDYRLSTGKTADTDRLAAGWQNHLARREALFGIITKAEPLNFDAYVPQARWRQTWRRPIFALNKPGMISGDPVVELPERFRGLV